MFESVAQLPRKAIQIRDSYLSWIDAKAGDELNPDTPTTAHNLRNLVAALQGYKQRAEEVVADPDFGTLSLELQRDMQKLASETGAGVDEIVVGADPEKIWLALPQQDKEQITQHKLVERFEVDRINARLTMKRVLETIPAPPEPVPDP